MSDWPLLPVVLAVPLTAALAVIADGWSRKRVERRNELRAWERVVKGRQG